MAAALRPCLQQSTGLKLLPTITAQDDRGKRVGVVAKRHLSCEPHMGGPLPLAVRNRVFAELQNGRTDPSPAERRADLWVWVAVIVGVTLMALVPQLMNRLARAFNSQAIGMTIAMIVFVLAYGIIGWVVVTAIFRRNAQRIARTIAAAGHCPTCGYSFAELEAAADGCTVCPECGGAWRAAAPATEPVSTRA